MTAKPDRRAPDSANRPTVNRPRGSELRMARCRDGKGVMPDRMRQNDPVLGKEMRIAGPHGRFTRP